MHGEGCVCSTCTAGSGHCCGGAYHGGGFGWGLVRVVIGLVIVGIVFSLGFLMGQLRMLVTVAEHGYPVGMQQERY